MKAESMAGVLNLAHLTSNFYIISTGDQGLCAAPQCYDQLPHTPPWWLSFPDPVIYLALTLSHPGYNTEAGGSDSPESRRQKLIR